MHLRPEPLESPLSSEDPFQPPDRIGGRPLLSGVCPPFNPRDFCLYYIHLEFATSKSLLRMNSLLKHITLPIFNIIQTPLFATLAWPLAFPTLLKTWLPSALKKTHPSLRGDLWTHHSSMSQVIHLQGCYLGAMDGAPWI